VYRANIAEFFHHIGQVKYKRGHVKVNAHINYSTTHEDFAQSVPFNIVGKHAGGSKFRDPRTGKVHKHLNFCSIGIELPGPVNSPLPTKIIDRFRSTIVFLLEVVPSLSVLVRHRDVDHRKKDPGKNFEWDWVSDLGLYLPFKRRT
jgi:N-acetyl-anhydromuramyl-L-alanine amidase AmpD